MSEININSKIVTAPFQTIACVERLKKTLYQDSLTPAQLKKCQKELYAIDPNILPPLDKKHYQSLCKQLEQRLSHLQKGGGAEQTATKIEGLKGKKNYPSYPFPSPAFPRGRALKSPLNLPAFNDPSSDSEIAIDLCLMAQRLFKKDIRGGLSSFRKLPESIKKELSDHCVFLKSSSIEELVEKEKDITPFLQASIALACAIASGQEGEYLSSGQLELLFQEAEQFS